MATTDNPPTAMLLGADRGRRIASAVIDVVLMVVLSHCWAFALFILDFGREETPPGHWAFMAAPVVV